MRKQATYLVLGLFLIGLALADVCQDKVKPNATCEMVTPVITCAAYNYSIIDSEGQYIVNGTLSGFDTSIYSFNFSEASGQFIIRLCDGTTREVYVESEDEGMALSIIIIPLVFGIMFLLSSFFLGEEHKVLKLFMFGLSFLATTMSLYFGSVFTYYNDPGNVAVQAAISKMMMWVGWFDVILIVYIMVYVTIQIIKAVKQEKEEKLKY